MNQEPNQMDVVPTLPDLNDENFNKPDLLTLHHLLVEEHLDLTNADPEFLVYLKNIYDAFPPSKILIDMSVKSAREAAKLHSARINTGAKIDTLVEAFRQNVVPNGFRVKATGINNPERRQEIEFEASKQLIRAAVETQLAIYNRQNRKYADNYSQLFKNFREILKSQVFDLSKLAQYRLAFPGPGLFAETETFSQELLMKVLTFDCNLNPLSTVFLSTLNNDLATFALNIMKHTAAKDRQQEIRNEKKARYISNMQDKAESIFRAAAATTADEKCALLMDQIAKKSKNSKGVKGNGNPKPPTPSKPTKNQKPPAQKTQTPNTKKKNAKKRQKNPQDAQNASAAKK